MLEFNNKSSDVKGKLFKLSNKHIYPLLIPVLFFIQFVALRWTMEADVFL